MTVILMFNHNGPRFTTMDRDTAERIVRDGGDRYTIYTRDGAAYEDVCIAQDYLSKELDLTQYANGSWDY